MLVLIDWCNLYLFLHFKSLKSNEFKKEKIVKFSLKTNKSNTWKIIHSYWWKTNLFAYLYNLGRLEIKYKKLMVHVRV